MRRITSENTFETAIIQSLRETGGYTEGDANGYSPELGLFKTEVIHRRGPWKSIDPVEYATLECVDWFNPRRLLRPIGNIPPVELEQAYYRLNRKSARGVDEVKWSDYGVNLPEKLQMLHQCFELFHQMDHHDS